MQLYGTSERISTPAWLQNLIARRRRLRSSLFALNPRPSDAGWARAVTTAGLFQTACVFPFRHSPTELWQLTAVCNKIGPRLKILCAIICNSPPFSVKMRAVECSNPALPKWDTPSTRRYVIHALRWLSWKADGTLIWSGNAA